MTVTISYTAFLLTIVTGVTSAAMIYLIVVLVRLNRTVAKADSLVAKADDLLISLKTLADESTGTVVAARQLIDEGHRVVADVAAVSGQVRDLAESSAGQSLSLIGRFKAILAIVAGVKTAISTVKHFMERRRHSADG